MKRTIPWFHLTLKKKKYLGSLFRRPYSEYQSIYFPVKVEYIHVILIDIGREQGGWLSEGMNLEKLLS